MAARKPPKRSVRARGLTSTRRTRYLDALREGATTKQAAAAAGLSRGAFEWHRRNDPEFAAEHDAAYDEGTDVLEQEAFRRAVDGNVTRRDFDKQGNLVSETIAYSDRLMELLLKGRRPTKYRDNVKVEQVGKDDGPIQTEVTLVDTDAVYRGLVDAGVIQPGPSAAPDAPE